MNIFWHTNTDVDVDVYFISVRELSLSPSLSLSLCVGIFVTLSQHGMAEGGMDEDSLVWICLWVVYVPPVHSTYRIAGIE